MEVEDDLLFADLSKQVSLLIMDDDEHEHQNSSVCRPSHNSFQVQYIFPSFNAYAQVVFFFSLKYFSFSLSNSLIS